MNNKHLQKGAALIVSMMILLVLTIIGIASMNNSSMETNMAHNFRLNHVAFQLAESTIETIIERAIQSTEQPPNPNYDATKDLFTRRLNETTLQTMNFTAAELDPNTVLKDAAPTTTATVDELRYLPANVANCIGTSGACMEYTITVVAQMAGTGTRTTHTQVVSLLMPDATN